MLLLVPIDLVLIAFAIVHTPGFLVQPGAMLYLIEPIGLLVGYGICGYFVVRAGRPWWDSILRIAVIVGLITGAIESLNILLERMTWDFIHTPGFSIAMMILLFCTWGVAGAWGAEQRKSILGGVLAAICASSICMLLAVTVGFLMEFLLAPTSPQITSTWEEYKRSGWSDAQAFGIANTLDSTVTHLLLAPVIASIFGLFGSLLTLLPRYKKRTEI